MMMGSMINGLGCLVISIFGYSLVFDVSSS